MGGNNPEFIPPAVDTLVYDATFLAARIANIDLPLRRDREAASQEISVMFIL